MNKHIEIPLLADQHTHPMLYAAFREGIDASNIDSKEEILDLISQRQLASPDGAVIVHGWRDNKYSFSHDEIEKFGPLIIFSFSIHGLLVNSKARQILKEQLGANVELLDDQDWVERNLRTVLNYTASLNASADALIQYYDWLLEEHGIYYAEEMLLISEQELRLFEQANLWERTKFWAAPESLELLNTEDQSRIHGLKLFTDGAIGVRTAALNRPYDNGDRGMLMYSDSQLALTIAHCLTAKKNLAIHAIGDRAIEQVLCTIESCDQQLVGDSNIRMEHVQLISAVQAQRAKDLGIQLCIQPNFSSDSIHYQDRLDEDYCRQNNPLRMLIDQVGFQVGDDLFFGSDGMPHGIHEAINQSLFPPLDSQQLTLDEFQSGYCLPADTMASLGSIQISVQENRAETIVKLLGVK